MVLLPVLIAGVLSLFMPADPAKPILKRAEAAEKAGRLGMSLVLAASTPVDLQQMGYRALKSQML